MTPAYPHDRTDSSLLNLAAHTPAPGSPEAGGLLVVLLDKWVVLPEEWEELPPLTKAELHETTARDALLGKLVNLGLLTPFQADAVRGGRAAELILGHYRVLDVLGRGGMGIVYRGEHVHLRRQVAIKVTAVGGDDNPRLLHRFYLEARAVAKLQHPNIVGCLDGGRAWGDAPGGRPRDYFVMEYVPGQDLYAVVRDGGPLAVHRAAALFRQVADALAEAHRHGLVHRDLKPSNILVTPDWQAKLLDFGLALNPRRNLTEPGVLLGTIGYMAPEQARNPSGVDGRADLFALGASLFWTVTGREPFPESGNPLNDLTKRFHAPPPDPRATRPELPAALAEVIQELLQPDPDRRYPSAAAVSTALVPFTRWTPLAAADTDAEDAGVRRSRVLVVDDEEHVRGYVTALLDGDFRVRAAACGTEAVRQLERRVFDLVVLDATIPGPSAEDVIAAIRRHSPDPGPKILLISGAVPATALGGLAAIGADDFLKKPFGPGDFRSRVRTLLGRRPTAAVAPDDTRTDPVARQVAAAATGAAHPWDLMTVTVARLLTDAGFLTSGYRSRVARYVRAVAAAVRGEGEYARLKDPPFLNMLAAAAPLFDVGHLVIPGALPLKAGRLDPDERAVMQTHPTAGADLLTAVASKFPTEVGCAALAAELTAAHHERWDGTGYPDRLVGTDIPLSARVVSVATVYDAFRSRRPFRPPMGHAGAVRMMTAECPGHFDPTLLSAFVSAAARFDQIFVQYTA